MDKKHSSRFLAGDKPAGHPQTAPYYPSLYFEPEYQSKKFEQGRRFRSVIEDVKEQDKEISSPTRQTSMRQSSGQRHLQGGSLKLPRNIPFREEEEQRDNLTPERLVKERQSGSTFRQAALEGVSVVVADSKAVSHKQLGEETKSESQQGAIPEHGPGLPDELRQQEINPWSPPLAHPKQVRNVMVLYVEVIMSGQIMTIDSRSQSTQIAMPPRPLNIVRRTPCRV